MAWGRVISGLIRGGSPFSGVMKTVFHETEGSPQGNHLSPAGRVSLSESPLCGNGYQAQWWNYLSVLFLRGQHRAGNNVSEELPKTDLLESLTLRNSLEEYWFWSDWKWTKRKSRVFPSAYLQSEYSLLAYKSNIPCVLAFIGKITISGIYVREPSVHGKSCIQIGKSKSRNEKLGNRRSVPYGRHTPCIP